MPETHHRKVGVFADQLILKRALIPREPYLVSVFACEHSAEGSEVEVITHPASGIRRGRPLDLGALPLLPPLEAGSFIAGTILVMESDQAYRRAGSVIQGARHLLGNTQLGRVLARNIGLGSPGFALSALSEVVGILAERLRSAGDDELARFTIRLDHEDSARGIELKSWVLENELVSLVLRTSREAGIAWSLEKPRRWDDVEVGMAVRVNHSGQIRSGEVLGRPGKRAAIVGFADGTSKKVTKLSSLELELVPPVPPNDSGGDRQD